MKKGSNCTVVLHLWVLVMRMVEKQNCASSDLYFNMKDYEMFLYTHVKSVKNQMGFLLECLNDCGGVIVIIMKAFIEGLFCVRYCDTCFKGRISLVINDNLTVVIKEGHGLHQFDVNH